MVEKLFKKAVGLPVKLNKEERQAYKRSYRYLTMLRLAVFRRVVGFMNYEKLGRMYSVDPEHVRQTFLLLKKNTTVWKRTYKRLISRLSEDPAFLEAPDKRWVAATVQKAISLMRKDIEERTQFVHTYDLGLPLEDIIEELRLAALEALYHIYGLKPKHAALPYLIRTIKNRTVNIIEKYTAQKRGRLRKVDKEDRVYEAVVVSFDHLGFIPEEGASMHLSYDPVLLNVLKRRYLNRKVIPLKKIKLISLVEQGVPFDKAIVLSGISQVSLVTLVNDLAKLARTPVPKNTAKKIKELCHVYQNKEHL